MKAPAKEILVNTFTCGAASQAWAGLWSHPRSAEVDYNTIEYWTKLARTCEESLLDGIFLADSIGVADVYQGSPAAKIRSGSFVPNIDPMRVIPVMAAVTQNLTFGVTGNTTGLSPRAPKRAPETRPMPCERRHRRSDEAPTTSRSFSA